MNSRIVKIVAASVTVILVAATVVFALSNPFAGAQKVKPVNGVVTIPVSSVSDGTAKKFRFSDGGKDITFFIVKGNDGQLHAAFDSCDACYREKKGYEQQGTFMVCKNCRKKFAINMIGSANTGGCNPSHLDFSEKGPNVVLTVDALKSGARFF